MASSSCLSPHTGIPGGAVLCPFSCSVYTQKPCSHTGSQLPTSCRCLPSLLAPHRLCLGPQIPFPAALGTRPPPKHLTPSTFITNMSSLFLPTPLILAKRHHPLSPHGQSSSSRFPCSLSPGPANSGKPTHCPAQAPITSCLPLHPSSTLRPQQSFCDTDMTDVSLLSPS